MASDNTEVIRLLKEMKESIDEMAQEPVTDREKNQDLSIALNRLTGKLKSFEDTQRYYCHIVIKALENHTEIEKALYDVNKVMRWTIGGAAIGGAAGSSIASTAAVAIGMMTPTGRGATVAGTSFVTTVAAASTVGAVVGVVIGGAIAAAIATRNTGKAARARFHAFLDTLRNLRDSLKKELVEEVTKLVGSESVDDLTRFIEKGGEKKFMTLLLTFVQKNTCIIQARRGRTL